MPLQLIHRGGSVAREFLAANAVGFSRPKAIRFKGGVLSPGAYINNRALQSHPDSWANILLHILHQAERLAGEYDVVASVASGGVPHGVAVARHLHLPHFTVKKQEKGHGLAGLIDGDVTVLPGKRALLVEDMSSTFESSLKAIRALENEGAAVAHTLLLNTWGLPDFERNAKDRSVFALCTGLMFLEEAVSAKSIDTEHERIVRRWLECPEDTSWSLAGWELPKQASE